MRVRVSTHLAAPPEDIWRHVRTTKLLRHVAAPIIIFTSREPGGFPETWPPSAHRVWLWLFGFIPFGPQTVNIEIGAEGDGVYRARDNGSGLIARVWDHHISIAPEDAGARYSDEVRIEAGLLTLFVWAFAAVFYRWRQMRWRALVRRGFRF